MVDMANIIDAAKADFNEFHGLHRIVKKVRPVEQEQQMIPLCESVVLRSSTWVEKYKGYILELPRAEYETTSDGYAWMPMLEGIRDQLPFFKDLLYDQQLDHYLLEEVDEIRREVMELLAEHIYIRIFLF